MITSKTYRDWLHIGRERWFSAEELTFILGNHEGIGFPKEFQKPFNPQDGCMYIYDRSIVPDFKSDGIEWTKKTGYNKVYEQFIKLISGGVHAVTGLYCVAAHDPHFRRRCYRLARGDGGGVSQVHLVHYRDCSGDRDRSSSSGSSSISAYSTAKTSTSGSQVEYRCMLVWHWECC